MTDREAILKRRNRFIALALASGAAATTAGCEPCLSTVDAGADAPMDAGVDASMDAGALPCLSPPPPDVGPEDAPDAGTPDDAGDDVGSPDDAGTPDDAGNPDDAGTPLPCLSPPPRDLP